MDQQELMKRIMEIQRDTSLTDAEKALKRQALMAGKWAAAPKDDEEDKDAGKEAQEDEHALDDDTLKCAICFDLCVRPVTAPCQHNFCLKCFQDVVNKSKKKACPSCRHEFGAKFAANPRINTALTAAIRAFKQGTAPASNKPFARINNDDRPDEAFTTERAVRAGRANAASGRIMVNVPNDHFGPIPPEADPRGLGVRVGEWWKDRLDCRQWGAHFPHVAGIAGQSNVGAQSVVLSGGYEDDRDEGEWFLYTGSGGRDLSGNKRTNKVQSFDQVFDSMNKALKLSCTKGLPLRVVRSYKEKRSAYAPPEDTPVRYDGIYRIARCWRKKGAQGFLMCRYLFVRCDNDPAPWSSDESGDRPLETLPKDALDEIKQADKGQVFAMSEQPWWDWDAGKQEWGWARTPPASQKAGAGASGPKAARKRATEQERALREFTCGLCRNVLSQPVSTPCGHHFCKPCLDKKYGGIADEHDAGAATGRALRVRKVAKPCPECKADIMEFLRGAGVNREMEAVVRKLQQAVEKAKAEAASAEAEGAEAGSGGEEEAEEEEQQQPEPAAAAAEGAAAAEPPAAAAAAPESAPGSDLTASSAGTAGRRAMALDDHQVSDSLAAGAAPAPAPAAAAANTEAAKRDLAQRQLAEEFPEFDPGLVGALLEQEDGDEAAVKYALRKMRNQMLADEKKRAKQAKLLEGSAAAADGKGKEAVVGAAADEGAPEASAAGKRARGGAAKARGAKKAKA